MTADDKKQLLQAPARPAANENTPQVTRVAVKHLFFTEYADLPSGSNQVSNIKCYADPPQATRFFTCDWIPAWQMFEITFHPGGEAGNVVELMPACHIKRWRKA